METITWLLALVIAPFAIAQLDLLRRRATGGAWYWLRKERMPAELKGAALYMSEEDIRTTVPVALHGRVDQVFIRRNRLIPLDTKVRQTHRVYLSDVIQLSVYRLILRQSSGHRVAPHGYIRTVVMQPGHRESVCYHKTRLLSDREVIYLYNRYRDISTGRRRAHCKCKGKLHGSA